MTKVRGFSIVIHNVREDCRSLLEAFARGLSPKQSIVAVEKYPEQEGFHAHMFIQFSTPRSFKSMLSKAQDFSTKVVLSCPEGETRAWGRVECDQLRGSFEQATAYLVAPAKEKHIDPQAKPMKKSDRRCDCCGVVSHFLNMGADYPDGKSGRCRLCLLVPHRQLTNYGLDVRDLDYVVKEMGAYYNNVCPPSFSHHLLQGPPLHRFRCSPDHREAEDPLPPQEVPRSSPAVPPELQYGGCC